MCAYIGILPLLIPEFVGFIPISFPPCAAIVIKLLWVVQEFFLQVVVLFWRNHMFSAMSHNLPLLSMLQPQQHQVLLWISCGLYITDTYWITSLGIDVCQKSLSFYIHFNFYCMYCYILSFAVNIVIRHSLFVWIVIPSWSLSVDLEDSALIPFNKASSL